MPRRKFKIIPKQKILKKVEIIATENDPKDVTTVRDYFH